MSDKESVKKIADLIDEGSKAGEKEANKEAFKSKYGEKRLNIELETSDEIAGAKEKLASGIEKGFEFKDEFLGQYFDELERKEQAEDEINKLPGLKVNLPEIKKVEDLAQINVETLIKMEDFYPGILLYAFTDIVGQNEKVDFANWKGYSDIAVGTKFQVNFRGNAGAEKEMGAGELLPPKIRCISVYVQGDGGNVRTSTRRVGLKSRNDDAHGAKTGFFDGDGYMPVFSGDVVEIGGRNVGQQKIIDQELENKFTKEVDGRKVLDFEKYGKSQEAQEDKKQVEEIFKKNPRAQRSKDLSEAELDEIGKSLEGKSAGERVVAATLAVVKANSIKGAHCWDYVHRVYQLAGVKKRRRIFSSIQDYKGKDCGPHHASTGMLARMSPGDWIYYNNKNTSDRKGCHSAIFMGWVDQSRGIAKCASWHSGGKKKRKGFVPYSSVHEVDFKEKPVTFIEKPVYAESRVA